MISGYTGKSYFDNGGGVDYQCLHFDPEWPASAVEGLQHYSYIYGVQYHDPPGWIEDANKQDAPCVVCNVSNRTRQIMIPARETCPEGWEREYNGFLAAQRHTDCPSSFVCLDANFEYVPGGSESPGGGTFYIVEARCGTLPCPPYVEGKEVACAVCTQ